MAEGTRPIIIVKKKGGHGGHHGGAWKVAYADFVTAMMALFIVLWLMNTSQTVQESVAGFFRDPTGTADKRGTNQNGSGENFVIKKDDMTKLKEELQKNIHRVNDLNKLKDQVEITITSEGLRIELLESESGQFFGSGSAQPTKSGIELIVLLAQELGKLSNKISIEGHTDSQPYSGKALYSNWELSADRANAARRLMQTNGIGANQVVQVRGFADQKLRKADDPLNPSNRRITVIVQYTVIPDGKSAPAAGAKKDDETVKADGAKSPPGDSKSEAKPSAVK